MLGTRLFSFRAKLRVLLEPLVRRSADDSDDDSADGSRQGRGRGGNRDEIRLIVNDSQLQGLLSGSMIPVDQNGKRPP